MYIDNYWFFTVNIFQYDQLSKDSPLQLQEGKY